MSEHQDEQRKKPRLNLTTSQVAASALAACCASVVASYLGVAGTVIGAAVGSVVATTGAAIWGHLFRTGGKKLKQTLLVDGEPVEVDVDVERADVDAASPASVPAGRFYGAEASGATVAFETAELWHPKTPTAETQVITDKTKVEVDSSSLTSRINPRIKKYGKPMSIVVAIVAVFCISIVVGIFAGAPVRSAGSTQSPATTTTTTVTETQRTQGQASDGSSASSGSSASPSSGGTSSASSAPSGSAAASSSAGSAASPSASSAATAGGAATGQGQADATSTGSAAP
jgi:hypothetical protein